MTSNYMAEANAIASALRGQSASVRVPGRRRGPTKSPSASNLEVLAFMRAFFAANDQLPPVAVISRHFGWVGVSAAAWHISALRRFGLVESNAVGKLRFVRPINAK